jgi:hypothetical protein
MGSRHEIFINVYGQVKSVTPINQNNLVRIEQTSDYPVTGKVELIINPEKAENFTLSLRIPGWSENTTISVNGTDVAGILAGSYKKISRNWKKGDVVILNLDLVGKVIRLNGKQAIIRGPLVLARDTRFGDGSVCEPAVVEEKNGKVDLSPSRNRPANIWMSFTAPLVLGTDLEGDFRRPRQVNFCDFASAGNTWGEDSRYAVWIPQTLNVMETDYQGY